MDPRQLTQDMERIVHKYLRSEEIKRTYGTDLLLTRREIHTIQLIGENPGLNLRTLAERHGVTKGAASQMVRRLWEKELLDRRPSPVSLAEVALFLTEQGERAFRGHAEYHARAGARWQTALAEFSQADLEQISAFLRQVETILDTEEEEVP